MALKRAEELVQYRFAIGVIIIESIDFWKTMKEISHSTGACNL